MMKLKKRSQPQSCRTRQSGFTLLEAMIALSILSVGLLGLAQLFVVAINQNAYSRNNTMGTSVALDRLEDLRNRFNNEIATGVASSDLTVGAHPAVRVDVANPTDTMGGTVGFWASWTVTSPAANRKEVTISIVPVNVNTRRNRTITMTSYFAP